MKKLRYETAGKLFKITEAPISKYRSIDDPFDEDKKYFWMLLEKKGTTFYISDCSLIDYEKGLTAYAVMIEGKQLFEFLYLNDNNVGTLRFSNDTFTPSFLYEIEKTMQLIIEFLNTYTLITVSPTYVSF